MTESNVVQILENNLEVSDTGTTVTAASNFCSLCSTYYYGVHSCPAWYMGLYTNNNKDEVSELKAWMAGFLETRRLTERNLRRIREKLDEFIDS